MVKMCACAYLSENRIFYTVPLFIVFHVHDQVKWSSGSLAISWDSTLCKQNLLVLTRTIFIITFWMIFLWKQITFSRMHRSVPCNYKISCNFKIRLTFKKNPYKIFKHNCVTKDTITCKMYAKVFILIRVGHDSSIITHWQFGYHSFFLSLTAGSSLC